MRPKLASDQRDRDQCTLRQVLELGLDLVLECRNCRRITYVDVIGLVDRFGSAATLGEIRRKARCRLCRRQRVTTLLRKPG